MERMGQIGSERLGFPLSAVEVRLVRDAKERVQWDRVMDEGHYLGFRGLFGEGIRHVAVGPGGEWLALLGWCTGAFKVGARDRWIGWTREQQFRRLRLVANNCRFLVLSRGRVSNLASRVLALSVRRLSGDMEAQFGHPVLLAETFVDPSRFVGTCYRAAGWVPVGETRGFARSRGGWIEHGQPKQIWLRPLVAHAGRLLSRLGEPAHWGLSSTLSPPPASGRLRSLFEHLQAVPEFRSARGVRHSLASVLAIAVAARLAGARGPTAIAEFGARLSQPQLAAVRAFCSPTTGRRTPPSRASMHRILAAVDPDALDRAVRDFTTARCPPVGSLAIDGKSVPSGSTRRHLLLAAVFHGSGVIAGQTASDCAGGEILGARRLIRELNVAGRILTLDALHSCPETARLILTEGADYVLPIKGNHKSLLEDLQAFDAHFDQTPTTQTIDKAHGRIEERACAVLPLEHHPHELAPLPGRRQAFRITRRRTTLKTGITSIEVAYGLTSIEPQRAGPTEILALNRGHWEIENRVHHVRDVTFNEDRSRGRAGQLPRNLACLGNAAISIVRLRGEFAHQPQAHRHYAAHHKEAVHEVTRVL